MTFISTEGGGAVKRKAVVSDYEPEPKRSQSESFPTSPSLTSSPSSHPSTPPHTHKPPENWLGSHGPQRSPVIKIIPYNIPGMLIYISGTVIARDIMFCER